MADELDNTSNEPDVVPSDNPQDDTPPVVVDEPTDDVPQDDPPSDEPPADDGEPHDEPPADTPAAEPITFDPTAEDFEARATETLEKYDLVNDAPELHALITALQAKTAPETNILTEYADYAGVDDATPEVVKERLTAILERETLLTTQREEEPGKYRPNTDKYVETLPEDKADWLYYDLAKSGSQKYPGRTKFEEGMIDALAIEGDTVPVVLERYKNFVTAMKTNAIVTDVPDFIPQNLIPAFKSLSKEEREEIANYDPALDREGSDDAGARVRKLETLAKVQKGIDSDIAIEQRKIQDAQAREVAFSREVETITNTFTSEFREQFTQNLIKEVKFSDDPKRQSFEAKKQVMALELAFAQDATGEYARAALKDAGISFDQHKAYELLKSVEKAAIDLTKAKNEVDKDGRPLNPVNLNKAKTQFANVGREWQAFAKTILDQQTKVTTEGKAADIKNEVAKIKVAPKARAATGKAASPQTKSNGGPPPNIKPMSPEWYEYYANQEIAKTAAYRQ